MKVLIIKPVNATGKIWAEGARPSVTSELAARLIAGGYAVPDGEEPPAVVQDDPAESPKPQTSTPAPRKRKPRKSQK